MIQLFEEETKPITEKELEVLPEVVQYLSEKKGRNNAVKNWQIGLLFDLHDSRVRKVINHIRLNGLIIGLMASHDGYYIATTKEEMTMWIYGLGHRISCIAAVKRNAEMQCEMMFPSNEPNLFQNQ